MPTIFTCGGPARKTQFTYEGNFDSGVTIRFTSGDTRICNDFLIAAIDRFRGSQVKGGFSMTNPTPGGFGHWVENNSRTLNTTPLSPRHGSFIAAILQEMGYLKCRLEGNAVILEFTA